MARVESGEVEGSSEGERQKGGGEKRSGGIYSLRKYVFIFCCA